MVQNDSPARGGGGGGGGFGRTPLDPPLGMGYIVVVRILKVGAQTGVS